MNKIEFTLVEIRIYWMFLKFDRYFECYEEDEETEKD